MKQEQRSATNLGRGKIECVELCQAPTGSASFARSIQLMPRSSRSDGGEENLHAKFNHRTPSIAPPARGNLKISPEGLKRGKDLSGKQEKKKQKNLVKKLRGNLGFAVRGKTEGQ